MPVSTGLDPVALFGSVIRRGLLRLGASSHNLSTDVTFVRRIGKATSMSITADSESAGKEYV